MSKHAAVYTAIKSISMSSDGITSPDAQIMRSLGPESPSVRPFVVLVWGSTNPIVGKMADERLQVWAYDESSYTRIDSILTKIRDTLLSTSSLGDVQWNGYSDDLYDDIFKCATRYAAFTIPTGA